MNDYEDLAALVERLATASPERVAVSDESGRLTFGGLLEVAKQVEGDLAQAGAGPVVGLRLRRSRFAPAIMLGVWRFGSAFVPVDPSHPPLRQQGVFRQCGVNVVVQDSTVEPVGGTVWELERMVPTGSLPETPPGLAYVIFTSGSTGVPKGCMVTRANLGALLAGTDSVFDFRSDDVWSCVHRFNFDFSVWELWGALSRGSRVHIVSERTAMDPAAMLRSFLEQEVTILSQVPTAFRALVAALVPGSSLQALRYVVFGGERLAADSVRSWWSAQAAPGARLVNMYGITETTVHVTYCELTPERLLGIRGGLTPIGRPLPGWRVRLDRTVNSGDGRGEMVISGEGVSAGYIGDSERTTERFAVGLRGREYRSGDWAEADAEGNLFYVGRQDDQVQVRGFRIELGEVEAALRRAPGVKAASCILVEADDDMPAHLAAFLICDGTTEGAVGPVRTQVARVLPPYMRPTMYSMVGEFPMTPNGKVDRRGLRARLSRDSDAADGSA